MTVQTSEPAVSAILHQPSINYLLDNKLHVLPQTFVAPLFRHNIGLFCMNNNANSNNNTNNNDNNNEHNDNDDDTNNRVN